MKRYLFFIKILFCLFFLSWLSGCGVSYQEVEEIRTASFSNGYEQGKAIGYSSGFTDGDQIGFEKGKAVGLEEGVIQGYQNGFQIGYDEGDIDGYQKGLDQGYQLGYEDGYQAGKLSVLQIHKLFGYLTLILGMVSAACFLFIQCIRILKRLGYDNL